MSWPLILLIPSVSSPTICKSVTIHYRCLRVTSQFALFFTFHKISSNALFIPAQRSQTLLLITKLIAVHSSCFLHKCNSITLQSTFENFHIEIQFLTIRLYISEARGLLMDTWEIYSVISISYQVSNDQTSFRRKHFLHVVVPSLGLCQHQKVEG